MKQQRRRGRRDQVFAQEQPEKRGTQPGFGADGRGMMVYALIVGVFLLLWGSAAADSSKDKQRVLEGFDEYTEKVAEACGSIVKILIKVEGLSITQAEGIVRDQRAGTATVGCMAYVTGGTLQDQRGVFPHDILRRRMETAMWREDMTRAGDGPGTTTYSLVRDEILCTVAAAWEGVVGEEPRKVSNARYELEAGCMALPAGSLP